MYKNWNWRTVEPMLAPEGAGGGASDAAPAGAGEGDKDAGAAEQATGATDAGEAADKSAGKTFSQEDLDRIIGSKYAKWQKELDDKLKQAKEEARTEAEKLAQMSEAQRVEHEREQLEKKMEEREAAIKRREAEVMRRELQAAAKETLAQKGLPPGLSDMLNYASADACNASIEKVEKAFRGSVQAAVDERLRGAGLPVRGGKQPDYDSMTDEEYYKTTLKT